MQDPSKALILLVDDDPDTLRFIQYNLEQVGYQVLTAQNGKEGLDLAHRHIPQLIILDIMMPQLDGVEVCHQLRASSQFDQTIIVFLTARHEDYSQIMALDTGGDDYITKPIRPRVLISRIKALLRRSERSGEKPDQVQVLGRLKIDHERILVLKNDQPVELAKKEFELISLLASRPGKVFTREEIYQRIWGPEVIVGTRTLDVHIRKLREKLGSEMIRTVKGIGYKFEF